MRVYIITDYKLIEKVKITLRNITNLLSLFHTILNKSLKWTRHIKKSSADLTGKKNGAIRSKLAAENYNLISHHLLSSWASLFNICPSVGNYIIILSLHLCLGFPLLLLQGPIPSKCNLVSLALDLLIYLVHFNDLLRMVYKHIRCFHFFA